MRSAQRSGFEAVRVLDGGLATELERRGCDISGPLWSAHMLDRSPETIAAVHLDYLRAGADCIATASYQVSSLGYREMGRGGSEADEALRRAVQVAVGAREEYARENSRRVWIAASLGPYGAALHNGAEYHGRYEIGSEELTDFHARRIRVLADTAADLVAFETVPSLEEAKAIVRALGQTPSVEAWISFTCRDERHVAHGELLRECSAALRDSDQIVAVGINCTAPGLITRLLSEARAGLEGEKAVIVYPNSGEVWDEKARAWRGRSDVEGFAELARQWLAAGAQAVGGCCRTGPEHIRRIAAMARDRTESRPS